MAKLLLLRHGQSVWNAEGRWQGWADVDLSPEGVAAAEQAARQLDEFAFTQVYASDLRRAKHTAQIIAQGLGLEPVHEEAGMRERSVGEWAGLTTPEIEERWPGLLQKYSEATRGTAIANDANLGEDGESEVAPPGGETLSQISNRVLPALQRIAESTGNGLALVVTHGGIIRNLARSHGGDIGSVKNLDGLWIRVESGSTISQQGEFRFLQ